jgi:hypothetical protein
MEAGQNGAKCAAGANRGINQNKKGSFAFRGAILDTTVFQSAKGAKEARC